MITYTNCTTLSSITIIYKDSLSHVQWTLIWLLTCNNLFITYYTLYILRGFSCRVLVFVLFEKLSNIFIGDIQNSWRGHFVDKTSKQFFSLNLTPGARRQLKYNVQPDWSNQIITGESLFDWTIQTVSHGFITLMSTHIKFKYFWTVKLI